MNETDDLNQYGSNFINTFNQILDIHAPKTLVKPTQIKTKRRAKPWINNDIIKLIKTKNMHTSSKKKMKRKNQSYSMSTNL